jgi:hypothetical protein
VENLAQFLFLFVVMKRKQSTNKLPKPHKSWVWKYFQGHWKDSEVICTLCKGKFSGGQTSSLAYHLESIHGLRNPTKLNLIEQVHTMESCFKKFRPKSEAERLKDNLLATDYQRSTTF